ncbi:nucleotide-sugar transmembrane transporter [Anaeramoeba flamelloides]|uniref:Nucleotide-sugar transmembrane transporter n=1 Tax=Anaeramoeba flamelloides TaxID=1746091 RepID=A0AAV7ZRJ6_9EUKA|nr:nucleotide-sugar transmembrane transporter [Anaeramoeba flamelloides]KAJ6233044.1 nucleotide-sugar transmembrane transporter [Anaeramoeba flamelloides]
MFQSCSTIFKLFLLFFFIIFGSASEFLLSTNKKEGEYPYNPTLGIFVIEMLKLLISLIFSLVLSLRSDQPLRQIKKSFEPTKARCFLIIPATLFVIANNLAFLNLGNWDSSIFKLVMNTQIIFTTILSFLVLKRKFTKTQLVSVILLILGCVVSQMSFSNTSFLKSIKNSQTELSLSSLASLFLLVLQTFLSSSGYVSTEFYYKKDFQDSLHTQNAWLSLWSLLANLGFSILFLEQNPFNFEYFNQLLETKAMITISLFVVSGILTTSVLKYLNATAKTYASSLEIFFIALLFYFVFKTKMNSLFLISITIISSSILFYNLKLKMKKKDQRPKMKNNEPLIEEVPLLELDELNNVEI